MQRFLIVTSVKDEETMLPKLAKSLINQTIRPFLWVIVDGGSRDRTTQIIKKLESKYNWIVGFYLCEEGRSDLERYGYAIRKGFDYAIKMCKENNWDYDCLGLVDADVVLEKKYFKKLLKEFKANDKLGLASGTFIGFSKKSTYKKVKEVASDPSGPLLLFRRECYEEIGGFPTVSPDTVAILKSRNRGWHVREFNHIKSVHRRNFSSKRGLWIGYKLDGEYFYYLNYHPINAFLTGIYYLLFQRPFYIGFAYLFGYFQSMFLRKGKIKDPEVRIHFRNSFQRLLRRSH